MSRDTGPFEVFTSDAAKEWESVRFWTSGGEVFDLTVTHTNAPTVYGLTSDGDLVAVNLNQITHMKAL